MAGKRSTKVDATEAVNEYINKEDWRINANANTNYSHASLINNLAGKVIANYWLDTVYSKEEGDAHRNGDYHIHDLDILAPYCTSKDTRIKTKEFGVISIGELLKRGVRDFTVESYDTATNKKVYANARDLRKTREQSDLVEIEFEDGLKVKFTPDHKFLLTDGSWKEAQDLTNEDELVSID